MKTIYIFRDGVVTSKPPKPEPITVWVDETPDEALRLFDDIASFRRMYENEWTDFTPASHLDGR